MTPMMGIINLLNQLTRRNHISRLLHLVELCEDTIQPTKELKLKSKMGCRIWFPNLESFIFLWESLVKTTFLVLSNWLEIL